MSLNSDELRIVTLFSQKSKQLQEGVIKHIPQKTTIRYEVNKEVEVEGKIDQIAEKGLVVLAREFIGKGEAVEFHRVINILSKYYRSDPSKVERLRKFKKGWANVFKLNPIFSIGPSDNPITNKELFDMVAYANHIHTDLQNQERYQRYESIMQGWLAPMAEIQLHGMIMAIQKLTQMLRVEFVDDLLKKE